jgi:hypothetical protein
MLPHGAGTILLTGASASVKGYPQSAVFAMGKFALRACASLQCASRGPGSRTTTVGLAIHQFAPPPYPPSNASLLYQNGLLSDAPALGQCCTTLVPTRA